MDFYFRCPFVLVFYLFMTIDTERRDGEEVDVTGVKLRGVYVLCEGGVPET